MATTVTASALSSRARAVIPDAPPATEANVAVAPEMRGESRSSCPTASVTTRVATALPNTATGLSASCVRTPVSTCDPASMPITPIASRRAGVGSVRDAVEPRAQAAPATTPARRKGAGTPRAANTATTTAYTRPTTGQNLRALTDRDRRLPLRARGARFVVPPVPPPISRRPLGGQPTRLGGQGNQPAGPPAHRPIGSPRVPASVTLDESGLPRRAPAVAGGSRWESDAVPQL